MVVLMLYILYMHAWFPLFQQIIWNSNGETMVMMHSQRAYILLEKIVRLIHYVNQLIIFCSTAFVLGQIMSGLSALTKLYIDVYIN
jgi:hypothetical protein